MGLDSLGRIFRPKTSTAQTSVPHRGGLNYRLLVAATAGLAMYGCPDSAPPAVDTSADVAGASGGGDAAGAGDSGTDGSPDDGAETVEMPVGHYEIIGTAYTVAPVEGHGIIFRINEGEWHTGAIAVEGPAVLEVVGDIDEIAFGILTQDPNLTVAAKVGGGLECFREDGQGVVDGLPEGGSWSADQCKDPHATGEHTIWVTQPTANLPRRAVPAALLQ